MSEKSSFFIVTDSCCDLPESLYSTYKDFKILWLTFIIDGEVDPQLTNKQFYARLRDGSKAKTSQVTPGQFLELYRKVASEGMDILYVGFSSALSGTVGSGMSARDIVAREFPQRKIIVVDTLSASCGLGNLVDKAVQLRNEGKSIEETAAWLEDNKLKLNHWYTVDDLHFLQRGGRVSATSAWFGSALSIKPVMNMNNNGQLIPMEKVMGRKRSIRQLFNKMKEFGVDQGSQKVFISHGDCIDEVNTLVDMIKAEWGNTEFVISYVGNVIGSHTGPGVIALYFYGNHR